MEAYCVAIEGRLIEHGAERLDSVYKELTTVLGREVSEDERGALFSEWRLLARRADRERRARG